MSVGAQLLTSQKKLKENFWTLIARASPKIYHLLFADESIFLQGGSEHCTELMNVLYIYKKALGTRLNATKSPIVFGNRVDQSLKQDIKIFHRIFAEGGMGLDLGFPKQIFRSKMKVLFFLQNRFNRRTNTWSSQLLLNGKKKVHIKYLAQA